MGLCNMAMVGPERERERDREIERERGESAVLQWSFTQQ